MSLWLRTIVNGKQPKSDDKKKIGLKLYEKFIGSGIDLSSIEFFGVKNWRNIFFIISFNWF